MVSSGSANQASTVTAARPPVFWRSLGVVLAWNAAPAIQVALIAAAFLRDRPGCVDTCGFQALALFYELTLLVVSLAISVIMVAVLVGLSRRRPRLRRVALVGNVAAIPGILLTALVIFQLLVLLRQLRAR